MESLSRWFDRFFFGPEAPGENPAPGGGGPVCTVIGSGGKTSLIWLLAESQRRRKVLVSPTTKMYPPPPEQRRWDRCFFGAPPFPPDKAQGAGGAGAFLPPEGETIPGGICLAGILNRETGKLEALPPDLLAQALSRYDLTLLEGDGSRGLPLKGWADHEPVVPPDTTVTVGIIPITPLGRQASPDLVLRLPQFTRLTGAREGQPISPAHLAAAITGKGGTAGGTPDRRGLFYAARGKKLLFINQAEGPARREQARELAARLPREFRAGLAGIIAGSVQEDRVEVLQPLPADLRKKDGKDEKTLLLS
jgi:probable selenium-dependent hydroxylase accessory protein YqeC